MHASNKPVMREPSLDEHSFPFISGSETTGTAIFDFKSLKAKTGRSNTPFSLHSSFALAHTVLVLQA